MSVAALAAAAALLLPAVSPAATITVTATSDDAVNNGTCTLREAIDEANANSDAAAVDCNTWSGGFGDDTIQLQAATYVLDDVGPGDNLNGTGDLDVDTTVGPANDLTIDGAGAGATVIDPAAAWNDRIIDHPTALMPGTLTVSDLTVMQGNVTGDGGGIHSPTGTLVVEGVELPSNIASGTGGAIYAGTGSTLSITDSDMYDNGSSGGGGVLTLATTTTIDSTVIFSNSAVGSGVTQGGGISAQNTDLTVTDSLIKGNDATEAVATAEGGGMVVLNGSATIRGTEISENSVVGDGNADLGAGARLATTNPANIVNTTISGNQANGVMANGAGLVVNAGTVNLVHSTIGPNPVRPGGASALFQTGGTLNVRGSIVETSGANPACGGTITSLGRNVFTDATCGMLAAGDEANADPMLGPLQDNGGPDAGLPGGQGPLRSHLLANASTAVDHVPQAGCTDVPVGPLTVDQRGLGRPVDYNLNGVPECDAGSIELQLAPVIPVTPTPVTPAPAPAKKKKKKCKKKKKKKAGAAKKCKRKKKKQ